MEQAIQKRKEKEQAEINRGRRDCLNGVAHRDQGMYYNLGYADQYEKEQQLEKYVSSGQPGLFGSK